MLLYPEIDSTVLKLTELPTKMVEEAVICFLQPFYKENRYVLFFCNRT